MGSAEQTTCVASAWKRQLCVTAQADSAPPQRSGEDPETWPSAARQGNLGDTVLRGPGPPAPCRLPAAPRPLGLPVRARHRRGPPGAACPLGGLARGLALVGARRGSGCVVECGPHTSAYHARPQFARTARVRRRLGEVVNRVDVGALLLRDARALLPLSPYRMQRVASRAEPQASQGGSEAIGQPSHASSLRAHRRGGLTKCEGLVSSARQPESAGVRTRRPSYRGCCDITRDIAPPRDVSCSSPLRTAKRWK